VSLRPAGNRVRPPEDLRRALKSKEIGETLAGCMEGLPAAQREVFVLREMDSMETAGICKAPGVTCHQQGRTHESGPQPVAGVHRGQGMEPVMIRCRNVSGLLTPDRLRDSGFGMRLQVRMQLWMWRDCARLARPVRLMGAACRNCDGHRAEEDRIHRGGPGVLGCSANSPVRTGSLPFSTPVWFFGVLSLMK
jgi:hypothetical protein